MYFKIEKSGCYERKGLVEVRYDLFFDENDEGYPEHHVEVPVIPETGIPENLTEEENKVWLKALPKKWQNNPFCCHFCQFEPTVTDEEIVFVGDLALDMAYKNWAAGDLHKNANSVKPAISADEGKKSMCAARANTIKETDFSKIKLSFESKIEKWI